jgi:CHAD domain-containing protein
VGLSEVAPASPAEGAVDSPVDIPGETAVETPDGDEAPRRPTLGPDPGRITPDDAFGVAGQKAMWPHVARLLKLEPALHDGGRKDDLKRFRVASRRLRAALRLFADAYPDRKVRSLRGALGDLGRAAGAVRDLDVRIADLDRWASEQAGEVRTNLGPLRDAWRAERDLAAASLLRRLETRRHERLLRDLVTFVDGDARLSDLGRRSVRDAAASRLWRSLETLREAGALVRWASLPAVHEVRIDAKRLRYGLEFLGDVLPPSRQLLLDRLVALQDHLGALNDAAVTAAAVRAFLADRRIALEPHERATIARYAADQERELGRLRRGIGRPWRPVNSAAFARRLGRTVVIG